MNELERVQAGKDVRETAARIDAIGWGVLFIWIGVAFLADVGWSNGILGVGLVALGVQAARMSYGLPVEFFGLAMGIGMVAWGGWRFLGLPSGELDLPAGLMPILFIALGAVLVFRGLARKSRG